MYIMEHLVNILRGAARALELVPDARAYRVENRGGEVDARRLRGDFAALGRDLRTQLKHESTDYRTR